MKGPQARKNENLSQSAVTVKTAGDPLCRPALQPRRSRACRSPPLLSGWSPALAVPGRIAAHPEGASCLRFRRHPRPGTEALEQDLLIVRLLQPRPLGFRPACRQSCRPQGPTLRHERRSPGIGGGRANQGVTGWKKPPPCPVPRRQGKGPALLPQGLITEIAFRMGKQGRPEAVIVLPQRCLLRHRPCEHLIAPQGKGEREPSCRCIELAPQRPGGEKRVFHPALRCNIAESQGPAAPAPIEPGPQLRPGIAAFAHIGADILRCEKHRCFPSVRNNGGQGSQEPRLLPLILLLYRYTIALLAHHQEAMQYRWIT